MNGEWLQHTLLRLAAWVAPGDQRGEWLEEWRSELWYIPRREATRFCLGAFRDALWLRRNTMRPMTLTRVHLESPLSCLAFLAALGAMGILIAICLSVPLKQVSLYSDLKARDLVGGCLAMLAFSCLLLPGTFAVWRTPANRLPTSWQSKLRLGIFLALKIALVQPIMLCGFMFWIVIARVALFGPLGMCATLIVILRWVITDQQHRCPVCLRLLTNPVRIGSPSKILLDWYGAESTCSRGHGLLHVSEISGSYSKKARWLRLGDSWSGLFSARQL
jgi:hypothetical protein